MVDADNSDGGFVNRRRWLKTVGASGFAGIAGLSGVASGAQQEFPSQDIELVVPWAAGGGTDRTARALASLGEEYLDASLFVTNQTGGSGSAGFRAAANAEPDGHTVGVLTVEIATISHLGIANITPDAFAPIMQYNFDPASISVREDAPYAGGLDEFVSYAEENPGEIRISNSGIGAIWHLSAANFANEVGVDVRHVGYDGGAPATQAVVNGEVEATTASAAEVAPQAQDGPLTVLTILGEDRVNIFPDVPTAAEQGYENVEMGAWRGLAVPSGTPEDRVQTLNEAFQSVYESEEFQEFMENNGFGTVNRGPEEFGQFMNSELERFGNLIQELDL